MAERVRTFDWSRTPLGPIDGWSTSLRSQVAMLLDNRFPMLLWCGSDLIQIYNDAYIPVLADKHPAGLGMPGAEVWAEIWETVGPQANLVLHGDGATWNEDMLLLMRRKGFLEETYFTFSYSPVRDDDGPIGVLVTCQETTAQVLGERQLQMLRDLGAGSPTSVDAACREAATILARDDADLPFALIYLLDDNSDRARLVASAGMDGYAGPAMPDGLPLDADDAAWPLESKAAGASRVVGDLAPRLGPLPAGRWASPPDQAVVVGLGSSGRPYGFLIAGVSSVRNLDEAYRRMYQLVADQIATKIGEARAFEEQCRRVEALAEIDRAKSAFFSNVSHEFRTPLTLMLGPTEDALATDGALQGEGLKTVYRSELRMLKLVNALLDFARIEAGRIVASPEPLDLAMFTADLASSFRSAIERAGLELEVDTSELAGPVCVDPAMWETIVLNLLSNALKFTRAGSIHVTLRPVGSEIELVVSDTGTGIPAHELPRLFERFRRVENPAARTHEGSGIGLALVQELAGLHGGRASVESEVGRGSTFHVRIPLRTTDERPARREATTRSVAAFVEEAGLWAPEARPAPTSVGAEHILVVDDNADMRDYLCRLLEAHWRVTAVADGLTALEVARAQPLDLVLSDVMMPGLDGFELLAALHADPATQHVPVILLSARAGEEARLEGLGAGADDYLIKPFSARELVARIRTHLALAYARLQSERNLEEVYALLVQVPAAITVRRGPDWRCVFQNAAAASLIDQQDRALIEVWPAARETIAIFERVAQTGVTIVQHEIEANRVWSPGEAPRPRFWDVSFAPVRLLGGGVDGVMSVAFEVTDRVLARRQIEAFEERRRLAFDAAGVGTWWFELATGLDRRDATLNRLLGLPECETVLPLADFTARIHPDDRPVVDAAIARSLEHNTDYAMELRIVRPDGEIRWLRDVGRVLRDEHGVAIAFTGAIADITEQKRLAEAALAASRAKDEFLAMLGHELRNPLAPIVTALELMKMRGGDSSKEYETIERQVDHLTRLVDDLLDISRVTRGLIELKPEPLEIRDVLAKAIEIASPMIEQKQHHLTVDAPVNLAVDADPTRLAQVFANLLTNAARYTPTGGRIEITASRHDDRIRVRVRDNGMGIPPDMTEQIFELFEQGANRNTARSEGGLGIGLALVRNLVRLHGGAVAAHSEGPGRGSTFEVELPARTESSPARVADEPHPTGHRRRILVVDDNVDAAEMLCDVLAAKGHEVAAAYDGPQALALAAEFAPDAAILDIGLPIMDGYELGRRLRETCFQSGRLIALSGYGQEQDQSRSKEAGFDAHLVKPVNLKLLARALE